MCTVYSTWAQRRLPGERNAVRVGGAAPQRGGAQRGGAWRGAARQLQRAVAVHASAHTDNLAPCTHQALASIQISNLTIFNVKRCSYNCSHIYGILINY